MIIPLIDIYDNQRKIKPGDKVVLTRTKKGPYYVITPGHILTYMGREPNENPGDILKDEESGILIKKTCILDYELYEPSLEKARNLYIDRKEKKKFIEFVSNHCSKNFCEKDCKVECIEFVDEKHYKDNKFILNYIRKLKLNELQKEI